MNFLKNFFAKFKVKNKSALRHGSYSVAIIAVVVAGVIVLNVLMGILSERGVLSFDITSSKVNTMDEENIKFIKSIDKEVTITVLSAEDAYIGGSMNEYASNYMNVIDDSEYYTQTVNILKQYPQINDKIKVVFENFYSNKTESLATEYPNLFYGDILVECGEESRLVTFDDIYSYSDDTGYADMGYGYYYVDGNNVETAVSSAINTLTSGETKKMALIASHSNSAVFTSLYSKTLALNGFELSEIKEAIVQTIPEGTDVLVIAAPTTDLLASEVTVINEWLDNGGKKGKSLIFVPGATMTNLPVLKQFLAEWGIKYSSGLLYQTDKNYYYNTPTTMPMFISDSDITKEIAPKTGNFSLLGSNLVLEPAYEEYASRKTYVIASTNDTVTIAPEGVSEDWTPAGSAEKSIYAGLVVTEETEIVDNAPHTSYVAAFSSQEFIYSTWASTDNVQNMDIAVNTAMFVSGMNTNKKVFVPKTITTESFAAELTEAEVLTVNIIFMAIIPLVITVLGVVVWVRRKRR